MGDEVLACIGDIKTQNHFLGIDTPSYSAYNSIFKQWNTYFETRQQHYVVCLYLAFAVVSIPEVPFPKHPL